jgi:NCS2 family nucleobase:cation symporter-2/xanthine permease XanP
MGSEGRNSFEAPLVVTVTLVSILMLSFFGSKSIRLWAPLLGIIAGTLLSWVIGGLDTSRIEQAAWFGVPELSWPGFDLSFGTEFWVLLPAFIIVTVVGAIETFGDAIAVQRISHRTEKPTDYRTVQGALYADGLGNLLSGVAGTMPNTTYSTSISVVDMTGVASRKVGVFCGVFMVLLAFFPKVAAVILSIPAPVVGAYLLVLILLLFMHGVRMVAQDGLSYEKGFIVGMGFWLGMGFQIKAIFYDQMPDWMAPILGNGMTSGTIITVLLVALLSLRSGNKAHLKTKLETSALPEIQQFVQEFATRMKWDSSLTNRLHLAVEETMLALLEIRGVAKAETSDSSSAAAPASQAELHLELRSAGELAELDMAVASVDSNMEELIDAAKAEGTIAESQLPLRILASIAEKVQHFQFHGLDFISLSVRGRPQLKNARKLI